MMVAVPNLGVMQTPVLLLIFRRPDTTAAVLDVLRKVRPETLYVAADGPVPGDLAMAEACAATRQLVENSIDWPCTIHRRYSSANLGCRWGVTAALDWFFAEVSEGIVLEDDTVPDMSFFPYCQDLLERYREDSRIGAIAGLSLFSETPRDGSSYRFSIFNHCWGWASWRRAWRLCDSDLAGWSAFCGGDWLDDLGGRQFSRYFSRCLNRVQEGKCDTWDYVWSYSLWRQGMLTCVPGKNLVANVGFGHAAATHTCAPKRGWGYRVDAPSSVGSVDFPLRHPDVVIADRRWDRRIFRRHHHPPLAFRATDRLMRWIGL